MTPTEQLPTEAERMAYEAGFRIEISDREAAHLFPNHADDLAKHITEKLQKAYEKFRRGKPLD